MMIVFILFSILGICTNTHINAAKHTNMPTTVWDLIPIRDIVCARSLPSSPSLNACVPVDNSHCCVNSFSSLIIVRTVSRNYFTFIRIRHTYALCLVALYLKKYRQFTITWNISMYARFLKLKFFYNLSHFYFFFFQLFCNYEDFYHSIILKWTKIDYSLHHKSWKNNIFNLKILFLKFLSIFVCESIHVSINLFRKTKIMFKKSAI